MRKVRNLLGDVDAYLAQLDPEKDPQQQVKLAQDCINFSMKQMSIQLDVISNAANNTSAKKRGKHAHALLSRESRLKENDEKQKMQRMMKKTPFKALQMSFSHTKNVLSATADSVKKGVASIGEVMQPRKKSKPSSFDSSATIENSATASTEKKKKSYDIRLPRPADGETQYCPQEAATIIADAESNVEQLCGSKSKNDQRTFMRQFKDKMIADTLIPVQKTALNELCKGHGKPGQPLANPFWNMRGRKPILVSINTLRDSFDDQQKARLLQGWTKEDTKKVLMDALKAKGVTDPPCNDTINAYHSALMS